MSMGSKMNNALVHRKSLWFPWQKCALITVSRMIVKPSKSVHSLKTMICLPVFSRKIEICTSPLNLWTRLWMTSRNGRVKFLHSMLFCDCTCDHHNNSTIHEAAVPRAGDAWEDERYTALSDDSEGFPQITLWHPLCFLLVWTNKTNTV